MKIFISGKFIHLYYFANALVSLFLKICNYRNGRDFPGSLVVRTPCCHCRSYVQSLVREQRTHVLHSAAYVCVCVGWYTYIHTWNGEEQVLRIYQGCLLCHWYLSVVWMLFCSPSNMSFKIILLHFHFFFQLFFHVICRIACDILFTFLRTTFSCILVRMMRHFA